MLTARAVASLLGLPQRAVYDLHARGGGAARFERRKRATGGQKSPTCGQCADVHTCACLSPRVMTLQPGAVVSGGGESRPAGRQPLAASVGQANIYRALVGPLGPQATVARGPLNLLTVLIFHPRRQ